MYQIDVRAVQVLNVDESRKQTISINGIDYSFEMPYTPEWKDMTFGVFRMKKGKNTITLKGKRSGTLSYMRRLNKDAEEYLTNVQTCMDSLQLSTAVGKVGEDSIAMNLDYDSRQVTLQYFTAGAAEDEEPEEATSAFIYTENGIRLYSPLKFGNDLEIAEFTGNFETNQLNTSVAGQPLTLQLQKPIGWMSYEELAGTYELAGKGTADPHAMLQAIFAAIDIARHRVEYDEPLQNPLPKLYHEKRDDSEKVRFSTPKKDFRKQQEDVEE
jgi:hypothetical protein